MTKIEETNEIIDNVQADECILMCSLGKDSLVALDLLTKRKKKVYCVFMYFVKGLEHVERYIRFCKVRYNNIEFIQIPHWNLSYVLKSGMYCTPHPKTKLIKLSDIIAEMRKRLGVYYVALGMKHADSLNRNVMLKTFASNHYESKGLFYPLAKWTQKEVLAYMKQNRLPQPVRYGMKASNGVGFNSDCYKWMRDNAPDDLKKVLAAFPLSERILYEVEFHDEVEKEM